MTLKLLPGMKDESNRQYHENVEYLGHSALDEFIASIPLYHGRFISKEIEPRKETDALALGSAFHAYVLQPETADKMVIQAPDVDKKTKLGKEVWANLEATKGDRIVLKADKLDLVRRMADSVHAHPVASEAMALEGYCEQSCYVEYPEDPDPEVYLLTPPGKFKARFDKIFPEGHIVDLKSTRHMNIHKMGRDFHEYGYYRQNAFYEMVRDILMGPGAGRFWYIVTSSEEPYETFVFDLHPQAKQLGREENTKGIRELNERRKLNDWSSRSSKIKLLNLPGYAYKRD